jgi:acetate kinase
MKVMVLNLGSTSFKFKLFDMAAGEKVLATGEIESIGTDAGRFKITSPGFAKEGPVSCAVHGDAIDFCFATLREQDILPGLSALDAVGYKVAHGGPVMGARIIDDGILGIVDDFASFAPAHNPVYARTMRAMRDRHPGLRQVACFETAFHATIPDYRTTYGVPYHWRTEYGIRRYGFHGASHGYIAWKLRELEPNARRIVSMHLGGSSSLCAISDGKSIAESMGATPQSGVFHNNRVGDFDAFCIPDLVRRHDGNVDEVFRQLAGGGGFLGISGVSNDLRAVLAARKQGNERATLAVDAFVDAIVGYVGMFTAFLGGLDALVFTGGIGLRSPAIRSMVCEKLSFYAIAIDAPRNESTNEGRIDAATSRCSVWVLETNEELMVARQTQAALRPGAQA